MAAKTLLYNNEPATLMLTRYDEQYGGGLCIAILDEDKDVIDELSWNLFPNPFAKLGDNEIVIEKCNEEVFNEYNLGEFKRSISEGHYVYYIMELNWNELDKYVSVNELGGEAKKDEEEIEL